jgi:hypothetical protein
MRFFILLLSVFLVSCATPKTQPQAFYGKVYTPGVAEIASDGSFASYVSVIADEDAQTGRKAAYARLMLEAKSRGYTYFRVTDESTVKVLGTKITVKGSLYKRRPDGADVYPVDAIKRLLKDQPLAEPVRTVSRTESSVRKPANGQTLASTPIVQAPVVQEQVVSEPVIADEPLVIMAPEDITGSVKRTSLPANNPYPTGTGSNLNMSTPSALTGIPTGVMVISK